MYSDATQVITVTKINNAEWIPYFIPNKDLIRTPDYYEKSGADGYITSESYLTEKRIEGGEV